MYNSRGAYRAAWDRAYTDDPPVPLNVDLELASLCNLACPFCAWSDKADFVPYMNASAAGRRFMPIEDAADLIDECAAIGVPALKFNFRGESTLNPAFTAIIEHAASTMAFHDLLVNTNGNVPAHALKGLMACTKVMVSLDSLVESTYDEMRRGGDLSRACDTIRTLLHSGHPNVWVRRVITKQNASEPFAANVRSTFGPEVHVAEHYAFDRSPQHLMMAEKDSSWGRIYCGYPSQRLVVTTTGAVQACCVSWRDEVKVGAWPEQSLREIWNGEALKELRRALRAGRYSSAPGLCQNCTSFMSYWREERDKVQDKEVV